MRFRIALAALFAATALTACGDKAEEASTAEKAKEVAAEVKEQAADEASKMADKAKAMAEEKAGEIAKVAEDATTVAADKAKMMADKAPEMAEKAKAMADEKAGEMAKIAEDATAAAAEKAKMMAEKAPSMAEKAKAMAENAKTAAAEKAKMVAEKAPEMADKAKAMADKAPEMADKAKTMATEKASEMAAAGKEMKAGAMEKAAMAATATAAAANAIANKASATNKDTKVGFVYVGPIGDHGWSYQHNQSRLAVEETLGVQTTYVESVPEGADAERVIRQLAADGHNVIFTTSFGYMNPTLKVAKSFPDVKFEHATGYKRADNMSTYSARFYEGRAILGTIAGKMTKTNTIGYVASFPIPEVIRGINAMAIAARKVNPDVKIKVIWVNTWFDPGKEGDAAKALIDQGADIIAQHTDSPAPLKIAEERGVHGFGQASNMRNFAPRAQLTSIIDNWDAYYVARVKAAMDGTWESTDTWDGIESGMVEMAPYGIAVPQPIRDMANEVEASIVDGSFHAFQGPIKNQSGEVVVKEGETIPDNELLKMNWYVEGVEGTIPK